MGHMDAFLFEVSRVLRSNFGIGVRLSINFFLKLKIRVNCRKKIISKTHPPPKSTKKELKLIVALIVNLVVVQKVKMDHAHVYEKCKTFCFAIPNIDCNL